MPKAAVAFSGCRLNRYEMQAISESLELCGFELVPFERKADLYVINTCGVTGKAEVSSRQLIRRARRAGPGSKVVVTGCYSELKSGEIRELGADLVVSNIDKDNIRGKVIALFGSVSAAAGITEPVEFGSHVLSGMGSLTRGFVKIQEGCDRKCTYCTIWMSRGPVRSRRAEYIMKEVNRLYENGYKEIVLTGVHIGMYSRDNLKLTDLLKLILCETAMPRIRLSSLYPSEIDRELIDLISSDPRICPHAHISAQSGDDGILQAMGRRYDKKTLLATIDRLRSAVPRITIGADIIVGFPRETDKAFENTRNFIGIAGIHHLHVFSFSPRPNTAAADLASTVSPGLMARRAEILKEIGRRQKGSHLECFLGKELDVLVEKGALSESGRLTGLSENYLRVKAKGDRSLMGRIVKVRPYKISGDILLSDIVS